MGLSSCEPKLTYWTPCWHHNQTTTCHMQVQQLSHCETQPQVPRYQQQDLAQLKADAVQYPAWQPFQRQVFLDQVQLIIQRHEWSATSSSCTVPHIGRCRLMIIMQAIKGWSYLQATTALARRDATQFPCTAGVTGTSAWGWSSKATCWHPFGRPQTRC